MSKLNNSEQSSLNTDLENLRQRILEEKRRRFEQRTEAGDVPIVSVYGARPRDAVNGEDDGGPVTEVYTGVPRAGDPDDGPITVVYTGVVDAEEAAQRGIKYEIPSGSTISLEPEPAAREEESSPSPQPRSAPATPPRYVFVTLQRPRTSDGFGGRIAEGLYSVRGQNVVLTDTEGEVIGGRQLREDEDPASVARELLRERHAKDEFADPITYRPLGIA